MYEPIGDLWERAAEDHLRRKGHPMRLNTMGGSVCCVEAARQSDKPETVKRADLFGNVRNTYQTENERKLRQQQLFDRDKYRQAPEPPKGQERLL